MPIRIACLRRAAYGECDLVWAQDLWQVGGNSDWLLPNRIYEASWCGCPQIALAGTQSGRLITQGDLGYVLSDPAALESLLRGLDRSSLRAKRQALLARPVADFTQSEQDLLVMLRPALVSKDG